MFDEWHVWQCTGAVQYHVLKRWTPVRREFAQMAASRGSAAKRTEGLARSFGIPSFTELHRAFFRNPRRHSSILKKNTPQHFVGECWKHFDSAPAGQQTSRWEGTACTPSV